MSTLSSIELERVVGLTAPVIAGARVRAVHDDGISALFLTLRVPGRNLLLVLSCHPYGGRLALIDDERPPAPPSPRAFTQLLRKHLVGGIVAELTLPVPGDRFAALRVERLARLEDAEGSSSSLGSPRAPSDEAADDTGEEPDESDPTATLVSWTLLLSLTGRAANIALLDAAGRVRGAFEGSRPPRIGSTWVADEQSPPPSSGGTPRTRFSEITGDQDDAAVVLGGAVDARLREAIERREQRERRRAMESALRRALKRARRRAEAIAGDLDRAEAADRYKAWGDLLAANFTHLSRGMHSVTLDNFYDEMRPVEIPLDPVLEPRQNIDRYYARYKKFHRALEDIRARLAEAEERQLELELLAEGVADKDPELDDETLAERLHGLAVPWRMPGEAARRGRGEPSSSSAGSTTSRAWRTFYSRNGTEIRVGKGARDNDTLTFRASRGSDLWLHAAGWAGSHVIVRLERGEDVDPEALVDAATLAAHYSKARTGSLIEVQYTRQKHVRRARGGAPGLVYLSGHKTLTVRIEDDRLRRLKGSSPSSSSGH